MADSVVLVAIIGELDEREAWPTQLCKSRG